MLGTERRTLILETLRERGSVRVTALAEELGVNPVTIRRDLNRLEEAGQLRRVYGGAVPREHASRSPPSELARRIGEAAARLIPEKSVVFLAPGDFTAEIVPFLEDKGPLTIITNALDVAWRVAQTGQHPLHLIGGQVEEHYAIFGNLTTQSNLLVDWVVLEAGGLDAESGLTHDHIRYAGMARALFELGSQIMVLLSPQQVGRAGALLIAPAGEVDVLITGREASNAPLWDLSEAGVQIVLT
ncbi:MAG: DeoR/GlpR family DNA-binding transcription regulator [Anaerolineae bacterium]